MQMSSLLYVLSFTLFSTCQIAWSFDAEGKSADGVDVRVMRLEGNSKNNGYIMPKYNGSISYHFDIDAGSSGFSGEPSGELGYEYFLNNNFSVYLAYAKVELKDRGNENLDSSYELVWKNRFGITMINYNLIPHGHYLSMRVGIGAVVGTNKLEYFDRSDDDNSIEEDSISNYGAIFRAYIGLSKPDWSFEPYLAYSIINWKDPIELDLVTQTSAINDDNFSMLSIGLAFRFN